VSGFIGRSLIALGLDLYQGAVTFSLEQFEQLVFSNAEADESLEDFV
jgi:hypothetical protein